MSEIFNDGNFDEKVKKSDKPSMVDFWAPWCGPCLGLGPTIDALSKEYGNVVNIGKVNLDENPNLCIEYDVTSIPCVVFIKDGKVVDKQIGASPKSNFDKKIKKLLK